MGSDRTPDARESQLHTHGAMDLIRSLEGTIKYERMTFEERVAEEVAYRTIGTRAKWFVLGMVVGCLPASMLMVYFHWIRG